MHCKSKRIASIAGKTSDCFSLSYLGIDKEGYVPYNLGIGGGDYIEFNLCLDCGRIQSTDFPINSDILYHLIR